MTPRRAPVQATTVKAAAVEREEEKEEEIRLKVNPTKTLSKMTMTTSAMEVVLRRKNVLGGPSAMKA